MKQKWKNRILPRGVYINARGYVMVRKFFQGKPLPQKSFGYATPETVDAAIRYANNVRGSLRTGKTSVEDQEVIRWPVPYALKEAIRFMPQWRWFDASLSIFFAPYYFDQLWFDVVKNYRPWRKGELKDLGGKKFSDPLPEEKAVSDPTVNKELAFLSAAYNKLKELKLLGKIPNVKLPQQSPTWKVAKVDDKHRRRKRVLTQEEFKIIMSEASPRMKRRILAALNSCLRQKDVLGLNRDAFDLHSRQVEAFMNKVKRSYNFDANDMLMELYETSDGEKIIDDTNHEREFLALRKVCREKHGIPDFWFRDFRRTGAMTILGENRSVGAVLRVQAQLGHAKIETTMRYLGIEKQDVKAAGAALAAKWKYQIQTETKTETNGHNLETQKRTKIVDNEDLSAVSSVG